MTGGIITLIAIYVWAKLLNWYEQDRERSLRDGRHD